MRPVNLLPAGERRRSGSVKRIENSSFVVLGLLGVLLLASLYWVTTSNKINSDKSDIAKAKQETAAAKARTSELGPFAKFAKVKETRESSVRQLATQRFDWERMMREVALVLPERTSIDTMDASSGASSDADSASAPSSTSTPAPTGGASGASGVPSLDLTGCADSQNDVATMMVRLRAMDRVDDVTLNDSERPGQAGAAGDSSSSTGSSEGGASDTCPDPHYKFDVSVSFTGSDTTGKSQQKAPKRLGGGA